MTLKKSAVLVAILFFCTASTAFAITPGTPITVPSAAGSGYGLTSTTTGAYVASSTNPLLAGTNVTFTGGTPYVFGPSVTISATGGGGGGTGLATTSPISGGNLLEYSAAGAGSAFGVATSSLTIGTGLAYSGTIGSLVGGAGGSLTNTGVLSNIAGMGISISGTTGNVTIGNTGLLSLQQLGGGTAQTGAITFSTTTDSFNGLQANENITNSGGAFTFANNITGTLQVGGGGTGVSSLASGHLLYGSGSTAMTNLSPGTAGQVLGIVAGVPTWVATSTSSGDGTVGTGTTGQFPFYNANGTTLTATSSLFILPNGNIGVGSTTPTAQLSVGGNFAAGGTFHQFGNAPTGDPFFCNSANYCLTFNGVDNSTNGVNIEVSNTSQGGNAYGWLGFVNGGFDANGTYFAGMGINGNHYSNTGFGSALTVPSDLQIVSNIAGVSIGSATTTPYVRFLATTASVFGANSEIARITPTGLGIGTTSPYKSLGVKGSGVSVADQYGTEDLVVNTASTTGPIFAVEATTTGNAILFSEDQYGHLTASSTGAAPTISSCGTGSPAMGTNANDAVGSFLTGTSASGCTITFAHAYSSTPVVVISDSNTTAVIDVASISTTAFSVSMASALSAVTVYYEVIMP